MGFIIGFIAGTIGLGYFLYGKKQGKMLFMLCGAGLIAYPYFVHGIFLLILTGGALFAAPLLIRE